MEAAIPFVGRVAELATLAAYVDRARAGTPTVIVVEGPAGIGKTALVRQALRLAADFRVLTATADEVESRLPGGVVGQVMLRIGGGREGQDAPALEASVDPFAMGAQLLERVGHLQEEGPVAIVVDDAQWADTMSVQALAFALRRLQSDQVLAVLTARDEAPGLPQAFCRLADSKRGLILRLGGLEPSDLGELGSAVIGHALSRRAAQRLCAHTRGNPIHARALLEELGPDALEEAGEILPAPTSFAMVVVARLASCGEETVNLVQAAAVLGQRCPLGTAATVGGVTDPVGATDAAVAAHLLELPPHRQVAFVHPLVRSAVYHDLGPARRSALHAKAAAALDGRAALCHRVEAALVEDPVLAGEVEAHARHDLARGALASGAELLLAAARLTADPARREVLVLDALEALLTVGEVGRAAMVAREVVAVPGCPRRSYLLGHLALFTAQLREAETLLLEAWRLWEAGGDGDLGTLIATDLAQLCLSRLDSANAADWARRAIDASAEPELTTVALSVLVPCLGRIGRVDDAFAAVATVQRSTGAMTVQVEALLGRGMVRMWVDDLEEARADLEAVVAACRDRPASRQAVVALGQLADTEYRLGAWDDSVAHAAQAVSLVEDSDQVWFGAFAHSAATWALAPRGDLERAEAHARAASKAGAVFGDAASAACAATAAAHVAFFGGDLERAVQAVEPLLEPGAGSVADEPSVHPWRELHAEALLRLGRTEEAEVAIEALETLAASRDRRSALAQAARLRAGLEASRGCHAAARAGFETAMGHSLDLQGTFDRARTQFDYGSFLRRLGERRLAATHLKASWETFQALGARPLAERTQVELTACGVSPPRRSQRSPTKLTPQELAVARLVIAGRTNREVATELVVSPKTVEYHLSHVFTKLGVRSRTELAARLWATDTRRRAGRGPELPVSAED